MTWIDVFRSMKITEDVRKYVREHGLSEEQALAEGMREKGQEFLASGGEFHPTLR